MKWIDPCGCAKPNASVDMETNTANPRMDGFYSHTEYVKCVCSLLDIGMNV